MSKVWHIGGPLHGLVQETDEHTFFNSESKLALDDSENNFLHGPWPPKQVIYRLEKVVVSETDAEQLRFRNKEHHLCYYMWVYLDTRLDYTLAINMLKELVLLYYMRENGTEM